MNGQMNGNTNGHTVATNGHATNGKVNGHSNGVTAPRVDADEKIISLKMNGSSKEQKVEA